RKENLLKQLEGQFKNYNENVDRNVFEQLIELYGTKAPKKLTPAAIQNINYADLTQRIYSKTALKSFESLNKLLSGSAEEIIAKLNKDEGYKLAKILGENYFEQIAPEFDAINIKIEALQRTYMKAQLELFPDARIFPDANSTIRVTYGNVKGYEPK